MFTKNYKIFEISNKLGYNVYWQTTDNSQSDYVRYELVASPKDIDGNENYAKVDNYGYSTAEDVVCWLNQNMPSNMSNNYSFMLFGSGTTPPTIDDYKMEAPLDTDDIQYVSQSVAASVNSETDTYEMIFTNTLRNMTDTDIVIREVGYVKGVQTLKTAEDVSKSNLHFLFWREVLAAPITIAAGAAKTVTTVLSF